jgi:hypothetical protein
MQEMQQEIYQIRNGMQNYKPTEMLGTKGCNQQEQVCVISSEAYKASETLGKAYNSETMPKTKDINKKSVEVLKEIGQI